MIVLALLSWWYGRGWSGLARRVGKRVDGVLEFFSVGTLIRTLFAPFRQFSAGQVQGSFSVQMRALFDRTFSRFVGAFMRSILISLGFWGAVFAGLLGVLQLVIWPIVPLLPLIGLVGMIAGWELL